MTKNQTNFLTLFAAAGGAVLARSAYRRWKAYDFKQKSVLITGGSRGLGLVLARQLAKDGANISICARDEAELERARKDLQQHGADTFTFKCDVTNNTEVQEMVQAVTNRFGSVDVLINNAGTIQVGPMEVMTLDDYKEAMNAHFWGPLYTILAVLPGMRERGQGRIVNITSISGKISVPHLVPYSASKFALVGLSEGLRAELRKDGIVVTTVCPGLMRTGSPRNAKFKGRHQEEYAWFSISDSLPVTSISAERAASQIIDACRHGDAELVISVQAKLAVLFHGVFPGLTADMLGLVNELLPAPGGIGSSSVKGKESMSGWSPSWLTTLTEQAAAANNEIN
ncbi:MAG TPA: SDR family NAD(P)-dependent oxidoreductase [Pyrinomonadaceae bacterium]